MGSGRRPPLARAAGAGRGARGRLSDEPARDVEPGADGRPAAEGRQGAAPAAEGAAAEPRRARTGAKPDPVSGG